MLRARSSLALATLLSAATLAPAAIKTMAGGYSDSHGNYNQGGFLPAMTPGQKFEDAFNWTSGSGASVGLATAWSHTTPQLIRPTNSTTDLPISWFSQAASAMSGSAGPGKLHAHASASALMNPTTQSLIYWDNVKNEAGSYTAVNPVHVYGQSVVQVGFEETLTITSPSLPAGTWVNVNLKTVLHAHFSNPNNTPNNGASATFTVSSPSTSTTFQAIGAANRDETVATRAWSFKVGETITVKGLLSVAAFARAGYNIDPLTSGITVPNDLVSIDASNTGHFYFDLAPGTNATVTSESGHNYSVTAPIPEPATGIAACGLALLTLTRRTNRHTVQTA
jgi:hypothetical protein